MTFNRPRPEQVRRGVWLLAVASLAGLAGIWGGRMQRAKAPVGAFAWVHPANDAVKGRWTALRPGASVEAKNGEMIEWIDPKGVASMAGPAKREAAPTVDEAELLLWRPVKDLVVLAPVPAEPPRVIVRMPLGVTRFRTPRIDWVVAPGRRYDAAIVDVEDELAPPRLVEDVLPPIELSALKTTEPRPLLPGHIYEVRVREKGDQSTLGVARFLVSDDASDALDAASPNLLLREALEAMRSRPFRTGDAARALALLPENVANSAVALRVRYAVALEQGDRDACAALRRPLQR